VPFSQGVFVMIRAIATFDRVTETELLARLAGERAQAIGLSVLARACLDIDTTNTPRERAAGGAGNLASPAQGPP